MINNGFIRTVGGNWITLNGTQCIHVREEDGKYALSADCIVCAYFDTEMEAQDYLDEMMGMRVNR